MIFLCTEWPPRTAFPKLLPPPHSVLWLLRWYVFRMLLGAGMCAAVLGQRSCAKAIGRTSVALAALLDCLLATTRAHRHTVGPGPSSHRLDPGHVCWSKLVEHSSACWRELTCTTNLHDTPDTTVKLHQAFGPGPSHHQLDPNDFLSCRSKLGERSSSCWRELTCTTTHYATQPMPTPLGWVLHRL